MRATVVGASLVRVACARCGTLARACALGVLAGLVALAGLAWPAGDVQAADELNLYSHRQPFLIEPFLEAFTAETGIKVNVVYASKGLAQRLQAEGKNSPADVVLTVGYRAPRHLCGQGPAGAGRVRGADRGGAGPSARSPRALVRALQAGAGDRGLKDRVPAGAIETYEDLADPQWAGLICSRPGSHVYNRALMASMIAAHGEEGAEEWATGLVANLARRPQGNDRAQVKAIYEGLCDVALINSYYYGKLASSDIEEQRAWAASMTMIFPNQDDCGTHINISGGGVAKHSKNKETAVAFLEFLTREAAQVLYGTVNYEFPVNPAVAPAPEVAAWGAFKEDSLPIVRIAELAPTAQRVIDRTGW